MKEQTPHTLQHASPSNSKVIFTLKVNPNNQQTKNPQLNPEKLKTLSSHNNSPTFQPLQQTHLYSQISKDNEADIMKKNTKPISTKPLLDSTTSTRQNPLHSKSDQSKPKKYLQKDLPLLLPIHNQNLKPLIDHKEKDHQWNPMNHIEDPKPWQQIHLDIGGGGGGGGGGGFFGQPQQNPQNNYRGIKYDLPREFNGTAQDNQRWKEQLSLYFLANCDQLPSDHNIIICALYNMGEGASFWQRDFLTHHMQNGVPTFSSAEAFWQALDQLFLPFNKSESFLRKWLALKQLQRPIETYIMEFRILANQAGVRETQQLIHQFQEGLDLSIAICTISKHPENNLEEWFTVAHVVEETERMEADYYQRHPQIYS
ncbi:hypothetical protein D9756_004423 [Leucocoprinus leucothites]|uniref:Retrotransposon gag domain-containing protein n=1 Tax=Leucocoprinus leucothites TaxID=201217 RepID=A0A8H5DAG1_9AGAR|nr:hypothetical protein D9756_004423 [Leucoagaricus leucothites]